MNNEEYINFLSQMIDEGIKELDRILKLVEGEFKNTNDIYRKVNEKAKARLLTPDYILKGGKI